MKHNFNTLYTDKKSFFYLIKFIVLIIICISLIFSYKPITSYVLIGLVDMIITFLIILIIATTYKFCDNKVFMFSSIYFMFIGLLRFINYILVIYCLVNNKSNIQIINLAALMESLFCFFISSYFLFKKKKEKIVRFSIFFIINIFIFIFLKFHLAINLISLEFFLLSLWNLRANKLFKGNYINSVKIYCILLSICQCLILKYCVSNFLDKNLILMATIFNLLAYCIIYYWLIQNLINRPYNFLFKENYEKNDELRELNKKLRERNKELEEMQKKNKEKKKYIRKLFDNIPLPIIIINSFNYRISYGNKTLFKLLKKNNHRLIINKKINDLLAIKDINKFLKEKRLECTIKIEEEEIDLYIEVLTIQDERYVLLLKDITELKRSVKLKNEFDKKTLEEGIKNDFLSTISHDLKTPINVIYTACQLQNSFLQNDFMEKIKLYNHVNKENCMSLTRLANNLIDSSKLSYDYLKPQYKIYNIVELVEECANSLAEYIRNKELEFEFDTEEEEILVRCDKEFIERIIINLMSNAIKHTNKGIVKVGIFVDKIKVRIEVEDTGQGMDKEFLKKAFEKYSIENNSNGHRNKSTGIGLYVVKNLVELQGGEIFIESQKGKGTIVKIEFFREKINVFQEK